MLQTNLFIVEKLFDQSTDAFQRKFRGCAKPGKRFLTFFDVQIRRREITVPPIENMVHVGDGHLRLSVRLGLGAGLKTMWPGEEMDHS